MPSRSERRCSTRPEGEYLRANVLGGALAFGLVEVAEEKTHQTVRDFSAWYGKVRGNLFLITSGKVVPGGRQC